ncbi:MAG: class I SAM-dependent methyltransferase [Cyanobacteria bacterium P01_A01_bin.83]
MDSAEKNISDFYNSVGWESNEGVYEDTKRYEDLRSYAQEYNDKCRLRVLKHIPPTGDNMLDMASGAIPYKEYIEYSKNYQKRYCVDLSATALDEAKRKIGDRGVFLQGSFFDINLSNNFFDCAISLHTIYHMDRFKQEEAVRKLISVTKPGQPIIIVYRNPDTLMEKFISPFRVVKRAWKKLNSASSNNGEDSLYAFAYPINWWQRFEDETEIKILPWRSFFAPHQKILIPNNKLGKRLFDLLFQLEEKFPNFFVKHFQYPMIILRKKNKLQ